MTDKTEERLRETYGNLEPTLSREHLLAELPPQFTPKSPLPGILVATAALAACVIALIGIWPDAEPPIRVGPKPAAPSLLFEVSADAKAVAAVMESRLADSGIEGAKVEVNDAGNQVAVHLPANASPVAARALLMRPGVLEFRLVVEIEPTEEAPPNTMWLHDTDTGEPILVEIPVSDRDEFGGEDLDPDGLFIRMGQYGTSWVVSFAIVPDRKEDFTDFTRRSVKRRLAIIVDGRVTSAPMIQETLPGHGQISGGGVDGFSREEAEELAAILKSGPLPADVRPIEPR